MIKEGFEDYLQNYKARRLLFQEGDVGESFFVIKDGLIGVFKELENNRNQIATIGPGEVLGEMALIGVQTPQPRSASAETLTEVTCWEFSEDQFEELMSSSESFRSKILSHLSSRIRKTSQNFAEARQSEDQLYLSTFSLLRLIEQGEIRMAKDQTIQIQPSIESLCSWFNIPPRKLKVYLSAPDLEELSNLSERLENNAREVAKTIAGETLSNLTFKTAYRGDYSGDTEELDVTHLEEACSLAEKLNEKVQSEITSITRDEYEAIWEEYNSIKDRYEEAKQQPGEDETLIRRLGAFIKGIQKKLQTINASQFEE